MRVTIKCNFDFSEAPEGMLLEISRTIHRLNVLDAITMRINLERNYMILNVNQNARLTDIRNKLKELSNHNNIDFTKLNNVQIDNWDETLQNWVGMNHNENIAVRQGEGVTFLVR